MFFNKNNNSGIKRVLGRNVLKYKNGDSFISDSGKEEIQEKNKDNKDGNQEILAKSTQIKKTSEIIDALKKLNIIPFCIFIVFALFLSFYRENSFEKISKSDTQKHIEQTPAQNIEVSQTKPITSAKPAKEKQSVKPKTQKPINKYPNEQEYLNVVDSIISENKSLLGAYSVDATIAYTPPSEIRIVEDEWNGDLAYNFIISLSAKLPVYYDENGKPQTLYIHFSNKTFSVNM